MTVGDRAEPGDGGGGVGRDDRPGGPPEDEGGDPACWLDRVCDACGRLVETGSVCPACGTPLAAGPAEPA